MTIALLDYGAGNLTSVRKGLAAAGAETEVAASANELDACSGIVVPGVGHFAATSRIGPALRDAIVRRLEAGVPLLGICLGMQWLFEGSDESPAHPGLGLVAGRCVRLFAEPPLKVPHVGWNAVAIVRPAPILDGVTSGDHLYFTHSYAAPLTPDCVASASHGRPFCAGVQRGHVAGVQFHPEKSGDAGLRVLANFVAMTRR